MSNQLRIRRNQINKSSRIEHPNTTLSKGTTKWFITSDRWMPNNMTIKSHKAHLLWFLVLNQSGLTIQVQLQACLDLIYLRVILSLTTLIRRPLLSNGHNRTYQLVLTLSNSELTIFKRHKWCNNLLNSMSQSSHSTYLHGDMAATAGLLQEPLLIGSRYRWRELATANLNFW